MVRLGWKKKRGWARDACSGHIRLNIIHWRMKAGMHIAERCTGLGGIQRDIHFQRHDLDWAPSTYVFDGDV